MARLLKNEIMNRHFSSFISSERSDNRNPFYESLVLAMLISQMCVPAGIFLSIIEYCFESK